MKKIIKKRNKNKRYSFRFNKDTMDNFIKLYKAKEKLIDMTESIRSSMFTLDRYLKNNKEEIILKLSDYYPGDLENNKAYKFNIQISLLEDFIKNSKSIGLEPEVCLRKLIMKFVSENTPIIPDEDKENNIIDKNK